MDFATATRAVTDAEIEAFHRDGVVLLKRIIPPTGVEVLRRSLTEIFSRTDMVKGARTDMTKAAEQASANGSEILKDGQAESDMRSQGRYLTEIEGGRWHKELRRFELQGPLGGICAQLLKSRQMRFFMDHCFLKEPGSQIRTAFHQDAPYFPFVGEQAAVCWVPVDSVSFDSGAMGYVKGSHKWEEFAPNLLVSRTKTHENNSPMLPDIEANEDKYDVIYFDAEPGDVIIHHPRTVHGSRGNVTAQKRRLAASIRFCGDDVRWHRKESEMPHGTLANVWSLQKDMSVLNIASSVGEYALRRATRIFIPAGQFPDFDYERAALWCYTEMQDGETLDARDCGRCAFPQVWPAPTPKARL